jgi:hypothetical protein
MKFLAGLLVLFLLSCGIYGQSQAVKIPKGNNILIDGKTYPEEWDDARKIQVSDSVNLYFKADKNYIYIATQKTGDGGCVADLYYADDGKMVNLHASAKLGQRNFVAGSGKNGPGGTICFGRQMFPDLVLSKQKPSLQKAQGNFRSTKRSFQKKEQNSFLK